MSDEVMLVFSTFGSAEEARAIGRALVEAQLAACVNVLPGVESIYRWKGAVESAGETLVIIKTTPARFDDLQAKIRALHSYELPEIVALRPDAGLPEYLRWIVESCG